MLSYIYNKGGNEWKNRQPQPLQIASASELQNRDIRFYMKGKSSLLIFEKYANLKYKYGNRHFWCRGYYVSTVGANKKAIQEYIRNQLQEDYAEDQISIKEYVDPFTGEPVQGGK